VSKNMAVINNIGTVLNIIVCKDDEPETPNLVVYTEENPAYIGGTFDGTRFYSPKPYESWTFNVNTSLWEAPITMPIEEGKFFIWDETTLSWTGREVPND